MFDRYTPAAEPIALYRELAEVGPNEAGILCFANRYGRLKGDAAESCEIQSLSGTVTSVPRIEAGEPFEDWVRVVEHLHEAVALWDMAMAGDHDGLSEVLVWRDGRVYYLGTARYRAWRQGMVEFDDAAGWRILKKALAQAEIVEAGGLNALTSTRAT